LVLYLVLTTPGVWSGDGDVPFTVSDFQGLIRLLEAQPEWKAQLLRVLFPNAFLDLPRAVEALAEAQRRTEATLD